MDTLEDARRACTQASGKVEINGDLYRALHKVMEAIDEVCVAEGRRRDHSANPLEWLSGHRAGTSRSS
jgi:hypothetical protein